MPDPSHRSQADTIFGTAIFQDTDDEQTQSRLRARLAAAAAQNGLLDIAYRFLDTPVGTLLLASTQQGLIRVAYPGEGPDAVLQQLADRISPRILLAPARLDPAARELEDYFTRRRHQFNIPLDLSMASGFRRAVLGHLREIPYGQTASYGTLAAAAGSPKAARAVGSACASNPLPIVLPCHRIIRSDGTIGNYIGGTDAKRTLLTLETAA
jgi:methylated-DNA-[protein]-cysteine S-methyltransferase